MDPNTTDLLQFPTHGANMPLIWPFSTAANVVASNEPDRGHRGNKAALYSDLTRLLITIELHGRCQIQARTS